jgi:hypothetical protein
MFRCGAHRTLAPLGGGRWALTVWIAGEVIFSAEESILANWFGSLNLFDLYESR